VSEIVSVVLAAGKGERIGGPKALLLWPATLPKASKGASAGPAAGAAAGELPLAIAHAERRLTSESARVLIVARKAIVNELLGYVRPGIDLLSSTAADELGPAGSLAFAVSRMGAADAVVVTPVDTPPASGEVVALLLAKLQGTGALAVRPRHGARAGHPVVLRAEALEPYRAPLDTRAKAGPPPLREHLRSLGDRVVDVDVEDASVLVDLDTATDAVKVLGAMPRFLGHAKV
jgi:molybdenum cofactor cytidylyltransferase